MQDPRAALARRVLELRSPVAKIRRSLFPQQLEFIDDPSDMAAACCTRRAGKSHVAAADLLIAGFEKPNTTSLYLALVRSSAKAIIWPKFFELNSRLKLGCELKESELTVTLPNGSIVRCMGADMANVADRLRGDAYTRVVIDEGQSFGAHLNYLIDDVLEPACIDHNGKIRVIGTPGPVPAGVFYDIVHGKQDGWGHHRWSLLDNPHLPHAKMWLEKLLKRRKWTELNPTYQREYVGNWCHDPDALVYRFTPVHNEAPCLPHGETWHYVLGIDFGFNDWTTFAVVAYADHNPCAYVVRSFGAPEMTITKIGEVIFKLSHEFDFEKVVCDTGGLGKSIANEINTRFGLPLTPAEKTDKMAFIRTLNGDFIDGNIKILPGNDELCTQYRTLTKDSHGKEDPLLRNDLADSVLYSLRYARHYFATEKPQILQPGTPEWYAAEERMMEQRSVELLMQQQSEAFL